MFQIRVYDTWLTEKLKFSNDNINENLSLTKLQLRVY